MKTIKVYRHQCDFCRKTFSSRNTAVYHEPHCFKNEKRVPYTGELRTLLDECKPGGGKPGQIFTGTEWVDVPGYVRNGRYEEWPDIDGKNLRLLPASVRIMQLFPEEALNF